MDQLATKQAGWAFAQRRAREEARALPASSPSQACDALVAELEATRAQLRRAEAARREAHHRIANSLQLAGALLKAERRRIPEVAARDALLTAGVRLQGVAQLHRWLSERDEDAPVPLDSLLHELSDGLRAALGLDCAVACEAVALPGPVAAQIALVVSELALNALKHAYGGQDGGRVAIEGRHEGGRLRLTVSDHGDGLPEGFEPGRSDGLGMTVVGSAVRQIGGRLKAHTDGGAVFTLEIPLDGPEGPRAGQTGEPSSRSYSASGTP